MAKTLRLAVLYLFSAIGALLCLGSLLLGVQDRSPVLVCQGVAAAFAAVRLVAYARGKAKEPVPIRERSPSARKQAAMGAAVGTGLAVLLAIWIFGRG